MIDAVFKRLPAVAAFGAALCAFAPAANTATWVPTHRFAVDYGLVTKGNAQSLAAIDGDRLVVNRFQVPNQIVAPVTFRLQSNMPFAPTSFTLFVTAQSTLTGPYILMLDLFDWNRGAYEAHSLTQVNLTPVDLTLPCPAPPPVSRFVRTSDRLVVARIRVRATGPVALMSWSVQFDRAGFDAVR